MWDEAAAQKRLSRIVAEMVTGGADLGHLEQIEQIEAEMVTGSLGGADRSRDGHR